MISLPWTTSKRMAMVTSETSIVFLYNDGLAGVLEVVNLAISVLVDEGDERAKTPS